MILAPLQKLPTNVGNLGKIIVATNFELLPKVQKIAQSGDTECEFNFRELRLFCENNCCINNCTPLGGRWQSGPRFESTLSKSFRMNIFTVN